MDKLKQVFGKDHNSSPSGFFKSRDDDDEATAGSQRRSSSRHRKSTSIGRKSDLVPASPTQHSSHQRTPSVPSLEPREPVATPIHSHHQSSPAGKSAVLTGQEAISSLVGADTTASKSQGDTIFPSPTQSPRTEHHELRSSAPDCPTHPKQRADYVLDKQQLDAAEHKHTYLEPVVHTTHHKHIREEVQYERTVDRHFHHVQYHIQPVYDDAARPGPQIFHQRIDPDASHIYTEHTDIGYDPELLKRITSEHRETVHAQPARTVVDSAGRDVGQKQDILHVHHLVRPLIERDIVAPVEQEIVTTESSISDAHAKDAPILPQIPHTKSLRAQDIVAGNGGGVNLTTDQRGSTSSQTFARGQNTSDVDGLGHQLDEKLRLGAGQGPKERITVMQGRAV